MSIVVQAIYENGVLKPAKPLPLKELEQVQVTIERPTSAVDQTYGMIGWVGDADSFERHMKESEEDRWERTT